MVTRLKTLLHHQLTLGKMRNERNIKINAICSISCSLFVFSVFLFPSMEKEVCMSSNYANEKDSDQPFLAAEAK